MVDCFFCAGRWIRRSDKRVEWLQSDIRIENGNTFFNQLSLLELPGEPPVCSYNILRIKEDENFSVGQHYIIQETVKTVIRPSH